ncbi:MAG: hypothetical protein RLZZ54_2697 [Cyanobacteriota bacterium]|jgi:hypothetical protein
MSDDHFEAELETDVTGESPDPRTLEVLDSAAERPLFNIDGVTYAIDSLPETVTAMINDLLRCSQEQNELQFRLRNLQAAQQTYVTLIKQELDVQGVEPLTQVEEPIAA